MTRRSRADRMAWRIVRQLVGATIVALVVWRLGPLGREASTAYSDPMRNSARPQGGHG